MLTILHFANFGESHRRYKTTTHGRRAPKYCNLCPRAPYLLVATILLPRFGSLGPSEVRLCTFSSLASDKSLRIASMQGLFSWAIYDKALQIYRMPRFPFRAPHSVVGTFPATIESCHLWRLKTRGALIRHHQRIKLTAKRYGTPPAQVRNFTWFCNLKGVHEPVEVFSSTSYCPEYGT